MNTKFNRRDFLTTTGLTTLALSTFPTGWVSAADKRKQKVLYFTRSAGFEHSVVKRENNKLAWSERILTELGQKEGFEVVCTKDGSVFDGDLDQYDAIAFYTSGMLTKKDALGTPPMTENGKRRLLEAIAAGKGFVGFHAATDSFHTPGKADENQENPDPYIAMIGGEFIRHGPQQQATVTVSSPKFPGIAGMKNEIRLMEEWYAHKNFAKDLHVILVMQTKGMKGVDYQRPPFPAAWARMEKKGRVFFSALGHREDIWTNPIVQQHFLGGLAWAMRNVEADVTPNLQSVTPEASVLKR